MTSGKPGDDNNNKASKITIGALISHYRISKKIGSGGMGDVYLADDTRLDRQVALKFLPGWLKDNSEAQNILINEARAASKVNHPNLVSIYSIERIDDQDFIVMEFVEGNRLSDIINESSFSLELKINIISQIFSGLEAAHERGIIHRDIKPENIIITNSGQAKILDFGLAVCRDSRIESETSKISSTLLYSSPEQMQNQAIDNRSDIFSLGVLMYELFSGELPFKGEYEAAVIYSIINEQPSPITGGTPEKIVGIIFKALEKSPGKRYQNMSRLIADLENYKDDDAAENNASERFDIRKQLLRTVSILSSLIIISAITYLVFIKDNSTDESKQKMLAVLPLENLGQPENEYFADGMTDAIITELLKSSTIGVISLTSTIKYKGTGKDIRQIGRELGVDYVLMGTIQWIEDDNVKQIRISPKLIKVEDNTYLWAETYEPKSAEVINSQNDIAKDVSSALDVKFAQQSGSGTTRLLTENIEAFDYYLKGNIYFYKGWEERDLFIAAEMYDKAIKLDPEFAVAYAMLSRVHACLYWELYDRSESRINLAREMVDKALDLAPGLMEAKLALGTYYYSRMDYEPALDLFLEIMRNQPNNIDAIAAVAGVYRRQGMLDQAVGLYLQAFKLDPRSYTKAFDVGLTYGMMRLYPEAISYLDKSIDLAPDEQMSYILKAWLYLFWEGDITRAKIIIDEASKITNLEQSEYYWWLSRIIESDYQEAIKKAHLKSDTSSYYLHLARLYRLSGNAEKQAAYYDSARIVLEAKILRQPENARLHSQMGLAYAGLGNKKPAIEHGTKATSLLTPANEAIYSLFFLVNLAEIFVLVGEYERAVEQLEFSLNIPGFVSAPYLNRDPVWDPIRENSHFKQLLNSDN
ncbi:MAG: protein kinase [candidate division Zixibacteria bacterium]|nr:protein kinase [candidate division Zixibacteria bacterium]